MKKRNITARMISGLLSAVMVLQAAVTAIPAFASEMVPEEELKAYVEALPELHPVYRISRNITVKEPVREAQTSAEGNEGGEDDASDGESEDADADPAPETSPESVAEVPETVSPETAVETEEPHVVYEFTEEAFELEMAAAQETAQAMEEAGVTSEQAAVESAEESSSQAAEADIDEAGKVVESWTSTEEAHYIEKLPTGKYTLREETAPAGYLVAEDVLFTVKNTGVEQKVEMKELHNHPKNCCPSRLL